MADKTKIEWSDATWNPVYGCSKVSQGCKNCYAETFLERFRGVPGHVFENGFDVRLAPNKLDQPLRWQKPRKIFVNSMSDLFHEEVPFEYIAAVFGVMAMAERHTFQVLTKRPARMAEFFVWVESQSITYGGAGGPRDAMFNGVCEQGELSCKVLARATGQTADDVQLHGPELPSTWPLPNVWLGVSVEDQKAADERIPLLTKVPAALRFLSMEPLLGPVYMGDVGSGISGIDWVIVGGESGPRARPCDLEWIFDVVEQCRLARVPCFVKQLGKVVQVNGQPIASPWIDQNHPEVAALVQMKHPKGGDKDEWPVRLQVQQMPKG